MTYATTYEEQLRFCAEVMPVFLEYVRTHQTSMEGVELAVVKDGIVSFPATQVLGGVQKTVRVPLSVITKNVDDAENLCREMAEYARQQGETLEALIVQVSALMVTVKDQGDRAEAQGNAAQAMKVQVESWYSPFKTNAENWYSGIVADVAAWYSGVKSDWNTWFAARKSEWNTWFSGVSSAWNAWFSSTKDEWDVWFAARKAEWNSWFSGVMSGWSTWYATTKDDWDTWFAAKKLEWTTWFSSTCSDWSTWATATMESWNTFYAAAIETFTLWGTKEQERQTAEEIRLEMMAHPPIPSERGYWMFWDMTVNPHAYVESGYSSRGTMDWPEFFWDYDTMGVGVITLRDYTRFSIDEQGRFKMKM